jgi:hypothetical protein
MVSAVDLARNLVFEKRGWSSATAFAFDSYGHRVGKFDSRWSPICVPLDKALCFSLFVWLDSASDRVSVRMALATSSLQYTCHMPMPNTIGMAPHRKTALPRRSSLKVWDLKIVSPTTASSIRAPCDQSARVKALGS